MIPFIDLKTQHLKIEASVRKRMDVVFRHGQFIMGPEIAELENVLSRSVGVKHTVTCSSGTDALLMALMALKIGPGDAVFVPAMTFIATSESVERVGARICFVDVDPRTFNMDPTDLEKQIQKVVKEGKYRPAAALVVNLFGNCADFDAIGTVAQKYKVEIIEDAAQSFGASFHGKKSCSLARISCTSFFPAKPLGCYGDGGAVFTSNDEWATELKSIRVHGQGKERYHHVRLGLTARLDTLQAAVLLSKMEVFDQEVAERDRIASAYTKKIQTLKNAPLTPLVHTGLQSVWAQYSLLFPNVTVRDLARKKLDESGIPNVVYYPIALHLQPVYAYLGHQESDFPVSHALSQKLLSVPMHPYVTDENIQTVAKAIQEATNHV